VKKLILFLCVGLAGLVVLTTFGLIQIAKYNRKEGAWILKYDFRNPMGFELTVSQKSEALKTLWFSDNHQSSGVVNVTLDSKNVELPVGRVLQIDVDVLPGMAVLEVAGKNIELGPKGVEVSEN